MNPRVWQFFYPHCKVWQTLVENIKTLYTKLKALGLVVINKYILKNGTVKNLFSDPVTYLCNYM